MGIGGWEDEAGRVDNVDWIDGTDLVNDARAASGGTTLTAVDGMEASTTDLTAEASAAGSFVSSGVVESFASDARGFRRFPSINVCSSAMSPARPSSSSSEAPSFSSSAILFCIALIPFLTIGHFGRACPGSSSHTGHFAFTSALGVLGAGVAFDEAAAALPVRDRGSLLEPVIDICRRTGSMTGGDFACAETEIGVAAGSVEEVT